MFVRLIQLFFVYFFTFLELFAFTCPKVDEQTAATHPRYADPEDCQFVMITLICFALLCFVCYCCAYLYSLFKHVILQFYVCINGEQPRRNGCKLGQAFNDVSKNCEWARKIPEW